MKKEQSKNFDRESFENEIMTVIKRHFNADRVEDMTGIYSMYPEWIDGM